MNLPSKKSFKKIILVLLAVLAIAVLAYLLVVRPIQVRQERKQFEQAAAELEKLYTRVEAVAGKPDQIKREKTCDYSNFGPFSKLLRGCEVDLSILYEDVSAVEANSYVEKVGSALNATSLINSNGSLSDIMFDDTRMRVMYEDIADILTLRCSINYVFPYTSRPIVDFESKYDKNLRISLACSGNSKTQHYPPND